jgi:hypothetical protein
MRRADHPSRGVLPNVVCLGVTVKPRQCEGPGPLGAVAPWGGGGGHLDTLYLRKDGGSVVIFRSQKESASKHVRDALVNESLRLTVLRTVTLFCTVNIVTTCTHHC